MIQETVFIDHGELWQEIILTQKKSVEWARNNCSIVAIIWLHLKSLFSNKSDFEKICQSNKFSLDYLTNKDYLFLLKANFEEREYADYFPFYENALIVDVRATLGIFRYLPL